MIKLAAYLTVAFIFGFLISMFIFKNRKTESSLLKLLFEFKNTIDDYKIQNNANNVEIKEVLKNAVKLSKVLTTNQNLKGQFGENCLENIIRTCYPELNSDYFKQINLKNSDDNHIKPDFLIKLPNNKCILADCKSNLDKYIEYRESIGTEFEKNTKNAFIQDLNATISDLSSKKYESAKNCTQPDFILMYIPFEPVITMLYTDCDFKSVIKKASDKNIIIVGNSSVLTVIKLVKMIWIQDTQEKNMQNIISLAENIYDYISVHSKNLAQIKSTMDDCYLKFAEEYEKMQNDSKLFKYIDKLKDYGISDKSKRTLKK